MVLLLKTGYDDHSCHAPNAHHYMKSGMGVQSAMQYQRIATGGRCTLSIPGSISQSFTDASGNVFVCPMQCLSSLCLMPRRIIGSPGGLVRTAHVQLNYSFLEGSRGLNKRYAIHPGKIQPSGRWLTSSSISSLSSPESSSTETLACPTKDHIPFKIWSSKSSSFPLMEAFHPHMQISPATVPFSRSLEYFEPN